MAGDWMKIELELPDKPEVHAIAGFTNLDPDAVVGKLIRIWQWFDKHTVDGNAHGVTYSLLDRISGVTGFGEAMNFAGWIEQNGDVLTMPKFDRHTSASAKSRALTKVRVNKLRNAQTVTEALPEKRREEKNNKPSSATSVAGYPESFESFWNLYPNRKNKKAAFVAFKKINKADYPVVKAGLLAAISSDDWMKDGGAYIPHPASWLNAGGWESDYTSGGNAAAPSIMTSTNSKTKEEIDAFEAARKAKKSKRLAEILAQPPLELPWENDHVQAR